MEIVWKRRRRAATTVTLPNGSQVVLDRPFSEYTIDELAVLGITPGMGDGATVRVAARPEPGDATT